jgi:hypothetical protein
LTGDLDRDRSLEQHLEALEQAAYLEDWDDDQVVEDGDRLAGDPGHVEEAPTP